MKRLFALWAALALFFAVFSAGAEEWDGEYYFEEEGYGVWELELRHDVIARSAPGAEKGAAYDVYSAPFEDAWRAAGGKAKVSANGPFTLLGTAENGAWSMIEYGISGGARRIGWARIPNVDPGYEDTFPTRDALPCRLTRSAALTDDPRGKGRTAFTLPKGARVVAFGTLDGWTYVRTGAGGKTAWLFIESDALEEEKLWSLDENGVLTVREGVTRIGAPLLYVTGDENGDSRAVLAPLRRDDIALPSLIPGETVPASVRALVLPSTLRTVGPEGLAGGRYDHIVLSDIRECARDAFYGVSAKRIILTEDCACVDAVLNGTYVTVGAWETREGNPYFRAVNGVLFSADGKRLISYPNGAAAEHYTVPAGVEEIADRAFDDEDMALPLKTVSLPIGLKKIGVCAFAGCGRLISLTVPLTVTELSEDAFCYCVSLERLSLPPGLSASFRGDWAERGDFTHYSGDNGSWVTDTGYEGYEEDDEYAFGSFSARTDTEDGLGEAPWYASAYDAEPAGTTPAGVEVRLIRTANGRALSRDFEWDGEAYAYVSRWYPLDSLTPVTGGAFFAWSWSDPRQELRVGTGDSRVLGVTQADTPLTPVRVLDAPGGRELGHLFPGEQAEVLDKRDGFLRIRTVRLEGWIAGENFREILQAEE